MRTLRLVVAGALTLGAAAAGAQVTTIYSNDFQTAVNPAGALGTWSTGGGAGAASLYSRAGSTSLGQGGGDFYYSQTGTLGFTGLSPYTAGTVAFDIRLWDTWDSGPAWGPDIVRFNVNGGADLLNSSFPGGPYGGAAIPLSYSFGPGSGALNLNWISATTQSDEGWTIDNVVVTVDFAATTAPEPATVALVASGLLALGGVARRRRQR